MRLACVETPPCTLPWGGNRTWPGFAFPFASTACPGKENNIQTISNALDDHVTCMFPVFPIALYRFQVTIKVVGLSFYGFKVLDCAVVFNGTGIASFG
jgi:hypothetical protein